MPDELRPLRPETDFPQLADLLNTYVSDPVTEAVLREREEIRPAGEVRLRLVAEQGGRLAGFGDAGRHAGMGAGRFWIRIIVRPEARGQGIGTRLYDALHPFAREQGAGALRATVRDNEPACLRFAEQRGFVTERHVFESVLDVPAFDGRPFAGAAEAVEAQGIRFFSFADLPGTVEDRRKLYELNVTVGRDVPGHDPEEQWTFEQFQKEVFESYWFRPDGQLIAADGDRWIGMSAIGETAPGAMYNQITGVLKEYRGRNIALALKLLGMEFCRRHGAKTVRTHNASTNQPMLAINRKLGYRPEVGLLKLLKEPA
jgi:GNAT superfamily N-acetyltransferase